MLADPEVQQQLQTANLQLGEATVARWAKAKGSNTEVAEEHLRAHICWRAENVPGGEIHEVCAGLLCCSASNIREDPGKTVVLVVKLQAEVP